MRKERDTDHLTLALGLLGATIVAGLLLLLLPVIADRSVAPEALPQPDITAEFRGPTFDEGLSEPKLPEPEPPPAHLLNPFADPPSAVASNNAFHGSVP